jgi:broad specificity phosphatase PhoE
MFPNEKAVPDSVPRWPGAETRGEIDRRIFDVIREILLSGAKGDVALSAHGCGVSALCRFFGSDVHESKVANERLVRVDLVTGKVNVEIPGAFAASEGQG